MSERSEKRSDVVPFFFMNLVEDSSGMSNESAVVDGTGIYLRFGIFFLGTGVSSSEVSAADRL